MQQLELVEARWEVKVNVWGKDNLIVVQSFYYQECYDNESHFVGDEHRITDFAVSLCGVVQR